jgi:methionyl-tRNA synthetase
MFNTQKKFYITTSIAYTNALPHIGFALELIQADSLARFHRAVGENVFFLTGTDEHGTKIARKAKEMKKTPEIFTNEISDSFKKLTKDLNISNDDFIRTTDRIRHWPTVEFSWRELIKNNDIYKKKYKGLYCVGCEAFIKEKDLKNGKCPNHLKEPELIEEENYFFKLSKYAAIIKEEIKKDKIKIIPKARKNEIISFIDQGIEDVSVSRSRDVLKWGIPVPDDLSQTVYIWFEALLNYLYPKNYWPADVQCIGKDIFRFHALLWPSMLLALKKERPKKILVHGFITSNGQKMSKSLGNVIDPFELIEKYGADALRYFLLKELSSTEDGDFTNEKLKKTYNGDLAGGLGNLLARTLTMADKYWEGTIPKIDISKTGESQVVGNTKFSLKKSAEETHKSIFMFLSESFEFNVALSSISDLIKKCNIYIDFYKLYKPSEVLDNNKQKIDIILYDLLEGIRNIAWDLHPFLPGTADEIFRQLGLDSEKEINMKFKKGKQWGGLKPGMKLKKGKALFPKK